MFSDNGRISEKQLYCLVIMPVFAAGLFVMPYLFARLFGKAVLVGVMAFIPAAALYVAILIFIGGCKANGNSMAGRFSAFIDIIRLFIRLCFFILLSMAVLTEGQVPFINRENGNSLANMLVLFPLLTIACYGAAKKLESKGRLYEMLIWTLMFPYILMLAFGIKEADYELLAPAEIPDVVRMILYCFGMLSFFVPLENYLKLKSYVRSGDKNSMDIKIYLRIIFTVFIVGLLSLFIACIYGINGAGNDCMVSIALMRYIELPFGVLQRFDVLMVWFFMTGCFVILCSILSEIRRLLEDHLNQRASVIIMCIIMLAAFLTVVNGPSYSSAIEMYIIYGMIADIPLSLILPLVRRIGGRRLKKLLFAVTISFSTLILNGCSANIENIEQRDYATVMMVKLQREVTPVFDYAGKTEDKRYHFVLGIAKERRTGEKSEAEDVVEIMADSFDELSDIYGNRRGKDLSLSHLKVILVGYEQEEQEKIIMGDNFKNLIYEMDRQDEVAKTCPLMFAFTDVDISSYIDSADMPVGTYLSALVRNAENKRKSVPKLMDFLKAFREGKAIMIYKVKKSGNDMVLSCIDTMNEARVKTNPLLPKG